MESPERNESILTPVDPGSPLFEYLCGLSPIKPSRSVHLVQTYAELSLPPPPAVFTSPPNLTMCGGTTKRGLVVNRAAKTHISVETKELTGNAWGLDKYNYPRHSFIPKNYIAAQADPTSFDSHVSSGQSQRQSLCSNQEHREVACASTIMPARFLSGDVVDYLEDSPEQGLFGVASSNHQNCGFPEDDLCNVQTKKGSLSSVHRGLAESSDKADIQKISHAESHYEPTDFVWKGIQGDSVFEKSGSSSEFKCRGDLGAEMSMVVDQESAAMAFLVGNGVEGGKNNWVAVTDFPEQEMPVFLDVKRASNCANLRFHEDVDLFSLKSGAEERTSCTDTLVLEDSKAFLRGIRRRCLDFETSACKRVDATSSGKSSPLRSLSGSSTMPTTTSISSAILCDRAVATPDAIDSSMEVVDSHVDIASRPSFTSCTSKVLYPGLLRVSQSSFQCNTNLMAADKSAIDASKLRRDPGNSSLSMGIPSSIGLHLNSLTGRISFSPTNREVRKSIGLASAKRAVTSLLGMPEFTGPSVGDQSKGFGKSMVGIVSASENFSVGTTSNVGTGVVISLTESSVTLQETLPVRDMERVSSTQPPVKLGLGQSLERKRLSRADVLHTEVFSVGKKQFVQHEHDTSQESNVDFVHECDNSHCKKKRKFPIASGEKSGEGCKRCNCKKSKCLKLYCECFAAGSYCVGSCTCYDCFNKPEHEDIVLTTRQQIELRNPLAFAPKIIHMGETPPKWAEEIEIPASARHKRGCNCKKSLCLKKYCECYQAGVGCSEGCRCEGCKNFYGQKEALDDSNDKGTAFEAHDRGLFEDQLKWSNPGFQAGVENIQLHCQTSIDLSPITPSFQFTWKGRMTGRVRSTGKKCSLSPSSQSQSMDKDEKSSVNNSQTPISFRPKNTAQTPDSHHLVNENSLIAEGTPILSKVSQLSPRWDGLVDICTLTPLPHPPLRPTLAPTSTVRRTTEFPSQSDGLDPIVNLGKPGFKTVFNHNSLSSSVAVLSQRVESHPTASCLSKESNKVGDMSGFLCEDEDTLDFLMCEQGGQLSQKTGSHPTSSTHLGKDSSKPRDRFGSDNGNPGDSLGKDNSNQGDSLRKDKSKQDNSLEKDKSKREDTASFLCEDEDTGDFLTYGFKVRSPLITKSSSPKQKRVSPPHIEGMKDKCRQEFMVGSELPARSSSGLQSSRKLELKELPSLPPVMPLARIVTTQAKSGNKRILKGRDS